MSHTIVVENWYTRHPAKSALIATLLTTFLLLFLQFAYSRELLLVDQILPASKELVFHQRNYYRLWTTLFAHADLGHLLSNLFLFIPLTYLFTGYFGWTFYTFALFTGGVINALVLETLPQQTLLIGISGVVYLLGAAWLTLFLLIDRRERLRRRIARVFLLAMLLFIPEVYEPEISYSSHFLGFFFGSLGSIGYYLIFRRQFLATEVRAVIADEDDDHQDPEPKFLNSTAKL